MTALPSKESTQPWHKPDTDRDTRKEISAKITNILRIRKPDADEHWLNKLPDMARRLEAKLYSVAPSLEEYANEATLRARLQNIANDLKPPPAAPAAAPPAVAAAPVAAAPSSPPPPPPLPASANIESRVRCCIRKCAPALA